MVRNTFTKRAASVFAAATIGLSVTLAQASPAAAWSGGNVWVNFGAGNCPQGGSVVGIYWGVDAYSSGPATGDWGDNVIYPRVRIGSGSFNTLSYQVFCKKWGWYTYRSVVSQRSLAPSRSGQSYNY